MALNQELLGDLGSLFRRTTILEETKPLKPPGRIATVIVAADGTGDTDSIDEGLRFLTKTGGVMYIREGTYADTLASVTTSNISIIGSGRSTKITSSLNSAIFSIGSNKSGIVIADLFIQGAGGANTANHGIVNGAGTTNCTIRNCEIDNCGGSGISIDENPTGLKIFANLITNNKVSGIKTVAETGWVTITGNVIEDSTGAGINIDSSSKWIIANNILQQNSTDGIFIDTLSDNNTIVGNLIQNNDRDGIRINNANSNKTLISGNMITSNATAVTDNGTNTHPNGASGTTNLALDDLNIIA